MKPPLFARCQAHPNIALAKYWGKSPGTKNIPAVPSLSVTLAGMSTETTVRFADELVEDCFLLNGHVAPTAALVRVRGLLDRVRMQTGVELFAEVISKNDFPTAAGLASSASGFAALALAACGAAGCSTSPDVVSDLARQSSASSARSLFGGFVELAAGTGDETFLPARLVASAEYLPLCVLIAVTTEASKDVTSTDGMRHTAATSPFFSAWLHHAPSLFDRIKHALLARDLPALGDATEASALTMHATGIAADPGLLYWNAGTMGCFATVRALRKQGIGAWFTIDAGPHVKVLCHPNDATVIEQSLASVPGVTRVLVTRPGPGAFLMDSERPA